MSNLHRPVPSDRVPFDRRATSRLSAPCWGLGDAVFGLVGGFLVAFIAMGLWAAPAGSAEQSLGTMAAGWIGLWVGFLGVPLVASRYKGSGSLAIDFGLWSRWWDAAGLAVGVICQLVALPALYFLIQELTGDPDVSRSARQLTDGVEGAAFILVALVVTFAAPVVEEVFYRGLMLRAAARRFGTRWAVFGSSAIFGVSHFELVQFPGLFFFGAVLALLAVRTGRLGASIAAHMAFNGVAVIELAVAR